MSRHVWKSKARGIRFPPIRYRYLANKLNLTYVELSDKCGNVVTKQRADNMLTKDDIPYSMNDALNELWKEHGDERVK